MYLKKINRFFLLTMAFFLFLQLALPSVSIASEKSASTEEKARKSTWKEAVQSNSNGTISKEVKQVIKNNPTHKASFPKENAQRKKLSSNQAKKAYVDGEVIVKFKSKVNTEDTIKRYGFEKKKQFSSIGADLVKIPKGVDVEKTVAKLKQDPAVAYAQPNYKISATSIPSDTYFNKLWGLHNTGQDVEGSTGTEDIDIDLPEARDITEGNSQLVIAVIDTGIDVNHPDLKNNIWTNPNEIPNNGIDDDNNGYVDDIHGWDFYNHDNTVFDSPYDDHGTHVAGTIAASANNTIGVSGIAPKVKIMPLKFLDGPDGIGDVAGAIEAIQYAAKMGIKISNNSWGSYEGQEGDALEAAIESSKMLFVAAAGNDTEDNDARPHYPSSYGSSNILSVTAVDNVGNLANFSNYGAQTVDVGAPGVDILSTVPRKIMEDTGTAAQVQTDRYKAIFNGFGFEHISDIAGRQDAFTHAMQYLQTPVTTTMENNGTNVQYMGTWIHATGSGNSGNNLSHSSQAGAYTQLTFTGTAIKVLGKTHPSRGLADVYIDGKFMQTIDQYAPQENYKATVFEKTGLSNGSHTIKIVVKGQKSSQATGTTVTVDAFVAQSNPKVLLVQDDESDTGEMTNYLDAYTGLLNGSGFSYDSISVSMDGDGPDLATLQSYPIVVWFTGDASGNTNTTLTSNDQTNLTGYLNGGGHLLLSGQDALWAVEETSFVTDMLHLNVLGEGPSRDVIGINNTIYAGKNYPIDEQAFFADFITSNDVSVTTVNLVYPADSYENAYAYYSGTSMATPHVTGVAALLYSQNANLNPEAAISTLMSTGDTFSSLAGETKSGKMVNAYKALNADDDIPGKPIENTTSQGTLDAGTDTDDVFSIQAKKGETIRLNLSGATTTDFDLYLFGPKATTVQDNVGMLSYSEKAGTSSEAIEYVAQEDGTYYIDVYAYTGSGAYTLNTYVGNSVVGGVGSYEEDNKALQFTGGWTLASDSGHSGGKASQLTTAGEVSLTFTGTEVEWIGFKDPAQGIADVYIDGQLVASPSLYSSTAVKQQSILKKQVPFGKHTLTIKWTGKRDASARKSGSRINMDKLIVREYASVIEDNHAKVTYSGSWTHTTQSGNSGSNFSYSSQAGAYAEMTFTGTGVRVLGKTHSSRGLADVYIDGKLVKTIDQYVSQEQYKAVIFEAYDLPEGTHKIKIVVKGQKSSQATGTIVTIDAFMVSPQINVVEDNDSNVQYSGSWAHATGSGNSGNNFSYSSQANAYTQLTFTGTAIKVIGKTHPSRGLADVYIDGKFVQTIDQYAPQENYKATVFEKTGLSNGSHTIKIVVKGQKSSQATGTTVTVDAFLVTEALLFPKY